MKKKNKYYGIFSKNDNFLYGVFPKDSKGLSLAKKYLSKLSNNKKNYFYIKEK
jgi:hypothetical protein